MSKLFENVTEVVDQKIACMDKILEMNAAASEFWIIHNEWSTNKHVCVQMKLKAPDGTKVEINCDGPLLLAVDEAYIRFQRIIKAMPETDGRKLLQHSDTPRPQEDLDKEIPF